MPTKESLSIKQDGTAVLDKGYYHGIVFDIPGAEVKVNGQWIAFIDKNKDVVKAQNPMTLEWRLNGDLLRKMGYKQGDTLTGHILAVDDQWHGLSLSKDFFISLEAAAPDGINAANVTLPAASAETWYTVDGLRLDAKPTKPGVYVVNGQKVIVR